MTQDTHRAHPAGSNAAGASRTADAVVCGAGIAGAAAAWALTCRGINRIIIVDAGDPLSMTSDKSTECYRNWWPGPGGAMTALANRSIDLMETLAGETGNRIGLRRPGYLFATADPDTADQLLAGARASCALGAGPLRIHGTAGGDYRPNGRGETDILAGAHFDPALAGADFLARAEDIRAHFGFLAPGTCALLHVRRAGFLSAQQLGMLMLERARDCGATLLRAQVESVDTAGGRVRRVAARGPAGAVSIDTPVFVDAAGPFVGAVAALLGEDLQIVHERHCKLTFDDRLACVPRDAPLLIWSDPVDLPFDAEEREALGQEPAARRLLERFPAGVHGRPVGSGRSVMLYWTYETTPTPPVFPVEPDPWMAEILMRGMSAMVPSLAGYFAHLPRPYVDGGYYTKVADNRPLVGPLGPDGAFVSGAFSGYGIMTACAAGELLAAHVSGDALPAYAEDLAPERFDDPAYARATRRAGASGQI